VAVASVSAGTDVLRYVTMTLMTLMERPSNRSRIVVVTIGLLWH